MDQEILENTNFTVAPLIISLTGAPSSVFAGFESKEYEFVIFIKHQLLQPCLSDLATWRFRASPHDQT